MVGYILKFPPTKNWRGILAVLFNVTGSGKVSVSILRKIYSSQWLDMSRGVVWESKAKARKKVGGAV